MFAKCVDDPQVLELLQKCFVYVYVYINTGSFAFLLNTVLNKIKVVIFFNFSELLPYINDSDLIL